MDCSISYFSACNSNTPWTPGLNNDWFAWVMSDIDGLIHQLTPAVTPQDPQHLQLELSLFALHLLYFLPSFSLTPPSPKPFLWRTHTYTTKQCTSRQQSLFLVEAAARWFAPHAKQSFFYFYHRSSFPPPCLNPIQSGRYAGCKLGC